MAAGVKRSYQQMHGAQHLLQSAPNSREPSPLRSQLPETHGSSGLQSGHDTPSYDWTTFPRQASFPADASIVLIGVRGVGKSSLGVLAATAYNRRLIDSDRAFITATGSTAQGYRKVHGAAEYYKKHHEVFKQTLQAHLKGCVIVCSFSDLEHHGSALLRDYAQTHPVIHIIRDPNGIQSYLQALSSEKAMRLLYASARLLRSCTNFEFFNLTEKLVETSDQGVQGLAKSSNGLFLTLKRVERDFLKLLENIIGDHERMPSHLYDYPLSQVPITSRSFTLCSVVDVDDVVEGRLDLHCMQVGVDAVELRICLDGSTATADLTHDEDRLFRIAKAFATIRRMTIVPLILSISSTNPSRAAQETLQMLSNFCFRLAPEYFTAELTLSDSQIAVLLAGKGRTQVIGSTHMRNRPANGWNGNAPLAAYDRSERLGCDVVKITMPASGMADNFTVQAFRQRIEASARKASLIAYNTGKDGRTSICFNTVLTPVTFPPHSTSEHPEEESEPSLTARDVSTALFASFVYEPMHFFIYGANVSYSLSPVMHNAAYAIYGMTHKYGMHSAPTLDDFKRLCRDHHFGGAAVVQPYKTAVIPLLDGLSSHARAIGSVNTIIPVRQLDVDGRIPDQICLLSQCNRSGPVKALYGDNSDWIAIHSCLEQGLSPANTVRPQSTGLVCGAGGQARAAIYAMLSLGVRNIFICNRTRTNAQTVADHYNGLMDSNAISQPDPVQAAPARVRVLDSFESPWPKDFRQPSLIVSGIPTQAADGSPTNFTIPDDWLKSPTGGVVIELAYQPMITPIVQQMNGQSHKGWNLMDGTDVVPELAFAQFELFTGRRAPRKLMKDEAIKRYMQEARTGKVVAAVQRPKFA